MQTKASFKQLSSLASVLFICLFTGRLQAADSSNSTQPQVLSYSQLMMLNQVDRESYMTGLQEMLEELAVLSETGSGTMVTGAPWLYWLQNLNSAQAENVSEEQALTDRLLKKAKVVCLGKGGNSLAGIYDGQAYCVRKSKPANTENWTQLTDKDAYAGTDLANLSMSHKGQWLYTPNSAAPTLENFNTGKSQSSTRFTPGEIAAAAKLRYLNGKTLPSSVVTAGEESILSSANGEKPKSPAPVTESPDGKKAMDQRAVEQAAQEEDGRKRRCIPQVGDCKNREDREKYRDLFNKAKGAKCIYAGNISSYPDGKPTKGKCLKPTQAKVGDKTYECKGGKVICNPLVYGLDKGGSKALCVKAGMKATANCRSLSQKTHGGAAGTFEFLSANEPGIRESWNQFALELNQVCAIGSISGNFHCTECNVLYLRLEHLNRTIAKVDNCQGTGSALPSGREDGQGQSTK